MKYSRRTFLKGLLVSTAVIQIPFTALGKTLKPKPDLLSSKILLDRIQKGIKDILEDFMFEFNDIPTRSLISTLLSSFMEDMKTKRVIVNYNVFCDKRNNPEKVVNDNELVVWVYYSDNKSIDMNVIYTKMSRKGIEFNV